jgi:hypothetical protein
MAREASEMRHLYGIGLACVLSLAVFFAGGWGYLKLLRVPVINGAVSTLPAGGGGLLHDRTALWAFAALAGTALLAGLLVAVRRVSPLAPGLPGLALIGWTAGYGRSVRQAVHYIPLRHEAFGAGFEAMLMNGVLGAAGLALAVPLFIPSRWRSPRPAWVPGGLPGEEGPGGDGRAGESSAGVSLFADERLPDEARTAPYPDSSGDQGR